MTVRDSITRTRARTPGVEDDPTSATVRDRALGPTQCGISDVATKCTKGGRKPNICRCMLGAVLSWRCLGRHRLRCQPCSRIGENPPYGMIGGIEETSASSKPDPRLDPTRLRGALSNERPYRDLRNVALTRRDLNRSLPGVREKSLVRKCCVNPRSSAENTKNRHFRVRVLSPQPCSRLCGALRMCRKFDSI